jgi:ArsR family transcriptional regulator, virulence genes transcriptional regulator
MARGASSVRSTGPTGVHRVFDPVNEIDLIQITLIRALASPHRLRIIHLLGERTLEVNELARELDLGQAAVSQHLAAMRAVGLVEATREGRVMRYRLADPEIMEACDVMRNVVVRRLSALGSLAAAANRPMTSPERRQVGAATTRAIRNAGTATHPQPHQVTHR